nr:hypothetical protein [Mycoplasmopsis bovis]
MNISNQIIEGGAWKISIILISTVSIHFPAWKPKYAPIVTPIITSTVATKNAILIDSSAPAHTVDQMSRSEKVVPK